MTRPNAWQPIAPYVIDRWFRLAVAHEAPDLGREDMMELLRVYRAWLDAPEGLVTPYPEANDRATFLYFNGAGDVPLNQTVRLVPSGAAPVEGE